MRVSTIMAVPYNEQVREMDVRFNNQVVGKVVDAKPLNTDNTVVTVELSDHFTPYFISNLNQQCIVSTRGENDENR